MVGADGIFSNVRFDIQNRYQKKNFAVEKYINLNQNNSLKIFFISKFKGYAWNIPNNKKCVIGLGSVVQKTDLKNDFISFFNLKDDTNIKGAFLPTGNDILLNKDNIYFIGDAAGLISPITGEGIYFALASAYNLANNMNKNYKKSMKKIKFNIKLQFLFKISIFNTPLRNFFFKLYNKNKIVTMIIDFIIRIIL